MDQFVIKPEGKGTVIIPVEEFERLKQVERELRMLVDDYLETVVVEDMQWYQRRVYKASDYMRDLISQKDGLQKQLRNLQNKPIPMINRRGKTVRDL